MKKYKYTALKNNNEIITGELTAANDREARNKIRELGFIPTKIYTEELTHDKTSNNPETTYNHSNISSLSLSDKIAFTSELETILSSEISILEALNIIETNAPQKKLRIICTTIKKEITNGMTFYGALQKHYGEIFGPVFISLVKTGEEAGELDITLGRMLMLLKKQEDIKNYIINASIYPAIIVIMMSGLGVLFTKLVFPRLVGMMNYMSTEVPALARTLLDICNFVDNFWWLLIVMTLGIAYAIKCLFCNKTFKKHWDAFILKIPVISDFVRYINLSNFMTVLHISYEAGVPVLSGLELAKQSVENGVIKNQISNSVNRIKKGEELTSALKHSGAIPSAIASMLAPGERSGKLGKMLKDAGDVIDKKIEIVIATLSKLFPPVILLILGGIVLFIVLAFFQLYAGALGSFF